MDLFDNQDSELKLPSFRKSKNKIPIFKSSNNKLINENSQILHEDEKEDNEPYLPLKDPKKNQLISHRNTVGLKEIKHRIEDNYLIKSKWSYIIDIQGYALKYYIKPGSQTFDADDLQTLKLEQIRTALVNCIKTGQWLVFNFDERDSTSISKIFNQRNLPPEILNPLTIFQENVLKKVIRESDNFSKNDNFRLIFITKNISVPKDLSESFDVVVVDNSRVEEEELIAEMQKILPEGLMQIKLGKQLVDAAFDGNLQEVQKLLAEGASLRSKDQEGNTAFTEACLMGHYELVEYFLSLDNGPNINYQNFRQRTALHKASFNGHHQIVLLLLENGADPRLNDLTLSQPKDLAANKKTLKLLKLWDIEKTTKFWESKNGQKNRKFKLFYEYLQQDPKKREEMRQEVCDHASKGNFVDIERLILQGFASIETRNDNGCSLLNIACKNNKHQCAEQLIRIFNCAINTRDHKGWTPLITAAFHGYSKIISILIQNGADPTLLTSRKETALELARNPEVKRQIKNYEIGWTNETFNKMVEDQPVDDNNDNSNDDITPRMLPEIKPLQETDEQDIRNQLTKDVDVHFEKLEGTPQIIEEEEEVWQKESNLEAMKTAALDSLQILQDSKLQSIFVNSALKIGNKNSNNTGMLPSIPQSKLRNVQQTPTSLTSKYFKNKFSTLKLPNQLNTTISTNISAPPSPSQQSPLKSGKNMDSKSRKVDQEREVNKFNSSRRASSMFPSILK